MSRYLVSCVKHTPLKKTENRTSWIPNLTHGNNILAFRIADHRRIGSYDEGSTITHELYYITMIPYFPVFERNSMMYMNDYVNHKCMILEFSHMHFYIDPLVCIMIWDAMRLDTRFEVLISTYWYQKHGSLVLWNQLFWHQGSQNIKLS